MPWYGMQWWIYIVKFLDNPRSNFVYFHAVFGKSGKIIGWHPPLGLAPPLGNPGTVFHTANSTPYCLWQFLPVLFFYTVSDMSSNRSSCSTEPTEATYSPCGD